MENQVIEIRGIVKTVTCNADGKKVLIDKAFTNDVGGLDKLCGVSVIGKLESSQAALYIEQQANETLCTVCCPSCFNGDIKIPNAAEDGFTLVTCPSCAFGFMAKVNPDEQKVEIFDLTYRQSFPIKSEEEATDPQQESKEDTSDGSPTIEEKAESETTESEPTQEESHEELKAS